MRLYIFISLFILPTFFLKAQQTQPLEENKSVFINGIELGYRINKESTKKSGGEEYSRYVITLYAVNGECSRHYYLLSSSLLSPFRSNSVNNTVATFYVRNANGKRLTSTSGTVSAKEWWTPISVTERNSDGKEVRRNRDMFAGYIFRRGDQIENQIIVLVPQGESPKVEVSLERYIE